MDPGAKAKRLKMFQSPLVVGKQPEFGRDAVQNDRFRSLVGGSEGHDEPAVVKDERTDLETQRAQRSAVEFKIRFANGKLWSGRVVRASNTDVFGDEAVVPAQAQSGETEIHAARAQPGNQTRLEKLRKADQVEISQTANEQEKEEQHADAAPAKIESKPSPESLLGARRHITGRRPRMRRGYAPLRCRRRRF